MPDNYADELNRISTRLFRVCKDEIQCGASNGAVATASMLIASRNIRFLSKHSIEEAHKMLDIAWSIREDKGGPPGDDQDEDVLSMLK